MRFLTKLVFVLGIFFGTLHSGKLPVELAVDLARLLENTMKEEQKIEAAQWLAGGTKECNAVKDGQPNQSVTQLRECLVGYILANTPSETLKLLNVDDVSILTETQKMALALFSTQFDNKKIETKEIQSPYLLAASINVLNGDKNAASERMLGAFLAYIPSEFLEDSDY